MKKTSTRKTKVAAAADTAVALTIGMSTELAVAPEAGDAALDALMAELNGVTLEGVMSDAEDEVVLPSEPEYIEPADDVLAAAVSGAELIEAMDNDEETLPADATPPTAATEAAPEKKGRAKKAATPKEPKEPKTFYGLDKVKRLTDRGVAAVMLKSEEALTGEELAAAQQRAIDVVANSSQKVKNRTTNILEFATGKTGTLNNLIRVCLQVIEKDGMLVTGEKGNMWATMATCYGAGTIRSGGNNSVAALRDLKVIVETEKGYVINPDSSLYPRIAARLGAAAETVPVAEEATV